MLQEDKSMRVDRFDDEFMQQFFLQFFYFVSEIRNNYGCIFGRRGCSFVERRIVIRSNGIVNGVGLLDSFEGSFEFSGQEIKIRLFNIVISFFFLSLFI